MGDMVNTSVSIVRWGAKDQGAGGGTGGLCIVVRLVKGACDGARRYDGTHPAGRMG